MRQRLIKALFCIALSVSVFFCTILTALADESEGDLLNYTNGDIVGSISLEGVTQEYDLSTLAAVGEFDYTGATSIHTQTSYAHIVFSNYVGNHLLPTAAYASFELPVPVLFRMAVERGHTYSGQISFMLHVNMPTFDTNQTEDFYRQVSLGDFSQVSNYEGVVVSYFGFTNFPDKSSSGSCDVTVVITFDNYQPTFSGVLNLNSFFNINGYFQLGGDLPESTIYFPHPVMTCSVSSDWAGELYDYPTDAIVDSDGTLITNQTIQQQQIANQQAQQSQQQHQNIVSGYDNSGNDSMLADKGSVLQGFEQQQDQAINSGQQHVSDFSAQYDTAVFATMAPSFALVSTMFNTLWNGMGQFSTVLIIGLVLCVAGYILKLKH